MKFTGSLTSNHIQLSKQSGALFVRNQLMKIVLTLFTSLLLTTMVAAQNTDKLMSYKKYAGRYGSSSGICLFEDGKFLMYGYATAVFGHYELEKELLLFYPDKPELFQVFAHQNKSIGDKTRLNFKGFEKAGEAYIQFGQGPVQRVFNEDANCFDQPFVYETTDKTPNITLSVQIEENDFSNPKLENSWHYNNADGYNDFILVCNAPEREYEDFRGIVTNTANGDALKLSNYGGDDGYRKHPLATDEQWAEILQWKQEYDNSKNTPQNVAFANEHYKVFPETHAAAYQYDESSNQYIDKANTENDEYYKQNQYSDDRKLRKYVKLLPTTKQNMAQLKSETDKSIFFTVCGEGSEHSYKYNGFIQYDDPNQSPPVKTKPVKIQPTKKGNE